jgi:hypothetical protein
MREDGGNCEAAGALNVHEEGSRAWHELLELVLAGFGRWGWVKEIYGENLIDERLAITILTMEASIVGVERRWQLHLGGTDTEVTVAGPEELSRCAESERRCSYHFDYLLSSSGIVMRYLAIETDAGRDWFRSEMAAADLILSLCPHSESTDCFC